MVTRHVTNFAPLRRYEGTTGGAFSQSNPRRDDVEDDLGEMLQILNDLNTPATFDAEFGTADQLLSLFCDSSTYGQTLSQLNAHHIRCTRLLERVSARQDDLSFLINSVRSEFLAMKAVARSAYRQRGALLCARDWQSPFYSGSFPFESNRLSTGIKEHRLDYKRDGHLDAQSYEELFVSEYTSHLGSPFLRTYLANSGMAAFTTVLHWVADELQLSAHSNSYATQHHRALALAPAYFENLHLSRAFFPDLFQTSALTGEDLLHLLRQRQPAVVICDAVTNCGEVLAHDLETVFNWAASEADHKVAIIVDTTCLPVPLVRPGFLQGVPERVCVFLIESLAKHHQYGLDMVTGGIVVAHLSEAHHDSFLKTRARLGGNITDSSVGSLPTPHRERITRRMQRHSRNTRMVAEALQTRIKESPSDALQSISWLEGGSSLAPWFKGSCLSVHFRPEFRSVRHYQQYEQKVLELATARNLPVAFGTSFGFDITRLYVTAPSTPFEAPFLRIAIGTETIHNTESLIEIFNQASQWLAKNSARLPLDLTITPSDKADPPMLLHADLRSQTEELDPVNVFAGENGLFDYLCPANYAPTPLVELPADLNPLRQDGVRIFAKMMPAVPLMNIKSIPAFSMLSKAAANGRLDEVNRIIESSSGNTVLSLSVMAKLFGIDTTCALVDHSIDPSLARMLRLFGIELYLHAGPGHEHFGRLQPRSDRATKMGAQSGWFNPGQYSNPDNPEGFARWLAPDVWKQTSGRISLLSCALGTCGTMVGVSRTLREHNPSIQVVACMPSAGQAIPGPREKSLLSDVAFPWQSVANECLELTAEQGFSASIALLRRGIFGGPSSGMNYAGALNYLNKLKTTGALRELVTAQGGEFWCVFLCCDSPLAHIDEYYQVLGEQYFPIVHPVPELPKYHA